MMEMENRNIDNAENTAAVNNTVTENTVAEGSSIVNENSSTVNSNGSTVSVDADGAGNYTDLENFMAPIVEEPIIRPTMIQNFEILGFGSILYGIIYSFCMYKNLYGITSTLLVWVTFAYGYFVLNKLNYKFDKKHIVYGVLGGLLGLNLMWTSDWAILFVDYLAIILVFISGVFAVVCDNTGWDFGDHVFATIKHIFSSLVEIFDIFSDWGIYSKKKSGKNSIVKYVILGIAVSIPLLVIVIALLSGADVVFEQFTSNIFGDFEFSTLIGILVTALGAMLGSYAWIVHFLNKEDYIKHNNKRTAEPAILITIGIALGLVYVVFCGIQIIYLFAGLGELPANYTYAQYAREGFFQLLVVCLLNLVLVLIGVGRFKESTVLKVVLTVITGCTYIMVASSAYRMYLYVAEYQMSLLRIWVLWTLVWLTFMLTGAVINVYKSDFSLFRFCMIATATLYLVFAFARPGYLVAKYNLSGRYEKVDAGYIVYDLNEDAANVVYDYYLKADGTEQARFIKYFATHDEVEENKTTIRNFNFSRYKYYSIKIR